MQRGISDMHILDELDTIYKCISNPLRNMLIEKKDLCFDKDKKLTTYGKMLTECYERIMIEFLEEHIKGVKIDV